MGLVVLFPGWGTSKKLYKNLDFGEHQILFVDYFDLNRLKEEVKELSEGELIFFGWSLGAMLALKHLKDFEVDKLILISPTLNFLENQPKVVVKKMLRDLRRDKLGLLTNFSRLNFYKNKYFKDYLEKNQGALESLDLDYLEQGLNFLLEEDLRNLKVNDTLNPLIIIGEKDRIMKNLSSRRVLEKFSNYYFYDLEVIGHNLIYEGKKEVNRLIRGYLDDKEELG
ncbi:alpha/beta fold hydrolase [Halonatronum saccharophilum]|uniref:alpha/beta fold hydrolase n=1 Tax=Halonatronum saccharophilum TaxID=150060 RepID=UPI000484B98A|nr:alpha/beta hydrolase [Halonatronum saccharophilum]